MFAWQLGPRCGLAPTRTTNDLPQDPRKRVKMAGKTNATSKRMSSKARSLGNNAGARGLGVEALTRPAGSKHYTYKAGRAGEIAG